MNLLVGLTKVVVDDNRTAEINEGMTLTVKTGGSYEPTECRPRHNVAIIVPFRDRDAHLKAFLANLHPFLQRQQLAYTIFIVEQSSKETYRHYFNNFMRYSELICKNRFLKKIRLSLIAVC